MDKRICVIGIGRLGLCNALCFEKKGYNVLGYDINKDYVNQINSKNYDSKEPYLVEYLNSSNNFIATTDIDVALEHCKLFFIIINTPKKNGKAYVHDYLNNFLSLVNSKKINGYHLIISCSVNPGYFQNDVTNLLKDCTNIRISYNPQFVQQGDLIRTFMNPDMILIGEHDEKSGDEIVDLYKNMCNNSPKFCRMTLESAELCKFAIATFITSKISFANFIGDLADSTENANKFDILSAVGLDSRIGSKCLRPGWGYGGVCFPRDNHVLIEYANQLQIPAYIPLAAHNFNEYHAFFLRDQLLKENKDEYVFTDVAFKPNSPIPLIEESHKLKVAKKLVEIGKKVIIKDKKEVLDLVRKSFGNLFVYELR